MSQAKDEAVGGLINFIYIILMVVCVLISTVLSYFGLLSTFAQMTIPATIIICLILFAADISINHAARYRKNISGPLVILFIGLVVSTLSNFTYLYTNFMNRDVARDTYLVAWGQFQENMETAKATLRRDPRYLSAVGDIEKQKADDGQVAIALANLQRQALDANNPGLGPLAQIHVREIERLLNTDLTQLAIPDSRNRAAIQQWLINFAELVEEVQSSRSPVPVPFSSLIDSIDNRLDFFRQQVNQMQAADSMSPSDQILAIEEMRTQAREVQNWINPILSDDQRRLNFEMIHAGDARLGEIAYTLRSGFIDRPNIIVTTLSLAFSLFIDLLPLLYAIFLLKGVRTRSPRTGSPNVLR